MVRCPVRRRQVGQDRAGQGRREKQGADEIKPDLNSRPGNQLPTSNYKAATIPTITSSNTSIKLNLHGTADDCPIDLG